MHHAVQVCEALGDLNNIITCMDRLTCVDQQASTRLDLGCGPGHLQSQGLCLPPRAALRVITEEANYEENCYGMNTHNHQLQTAKTDNHNEKLLHC